MEDSRVERLESRVRELESELREIKVRLGMPAAKPVQPLIPPPVIVPPPGTRQPRYDEINTTREDTSLKPQPEPKEPVVEKAYDEPKQETPQEQKPNESLHKLWREQMEASRQAEAEKPKPEPIPKRSFEDYFGKVVLARLGGALVILGLLYFVALGINKGLITPMMQFVFGSIVCAGFVGFGLWKREEKEEFGQVMVGIGSCGMYLVSAGSYNFNHLFSGNTLVAIFVGLSLANLGFSAWIRSKSFLAIGVIGGLVGAVLPTQEGHYAINIILHLIIVGLAAFICSMNKWTANSMWLWLFSTLALLPLGLTQNPDVAWQSKVATIYASTLLCAVSCGFGKTLQFDPWKLFMPFILILAALANFAIKYGSDGVWHLSIYGFVLLGLSQLLKHEREATLQLKITGAAVVMVMAPWGVTALQAVYVYSAFAIASSLSVRFVPKLFACIAAWVTFSLSIVAYALLFDGAKPYWASEAGTIVAVLAGLGFASWAQARNLADTRPIVITSLLAVWLMLSRFAFLVLSESNLAVSQELSVAIGWMGFVAALNAAGRIYRMRELSILAWVVAFCLMAFYVNIIAMDRMPLGVDALVVSGMLALYALSATQTISTSEENDRSWMVNLGILIALPLYSRLGWLLLQGVGLGGYVTVALLLAAASAVVARVALWQKWLNTVGMAWIALAGSLGSYGLYLTADMRLSLGVESVVVLALAASIVYACYSWQKLGGVLEDRTISIGAVLVTSLYIRFAWVWLGAAGMQEIERTPLALALLMPFVGYLAQRRNLSILGGLLWLALAGAGAGFCLTVLSNQPSTIAMETIIGTLLAANAAWASLTWRKVEEVEEDIATTLGAALISALWTRLCWVWLGAAGMQEIERAPLALVALLPIIGFVAQKYRFRYLASFMWVPFAASAACFVAAANSAQPSSLAIESLIGIALALNGVWACLTWIKVEEPNLDYIYTFGALLIVGFWARLGWIWFEALGVTEFLRLPLAGGAAIVALALVAERKRFVNLTALTWAVVVTTYVCYLPNVRTFRSLSLGVESIVLVAMLVGTVLAVYANNRLAQNKAWSYSAGVLLTWWAASRLVILWLLASDIGLSFNASVTLSWVVYLIALMAIGFSRKIRTIRLWGFGVIFAISLKLFIYDTVTLSDMARVAAFILAGLSFIAIGYGFIRYSAILDQESER